MADPQDTVVVSFRVGVDAARKLDNLAKMRGTSKRGLFSEAINELLAEHDKVVAELQLSEA